MEVCVFGCGFVGLPLCALLNKRGHSVIGFDVNSKTIENLEHGISHIPDVAHDELKEIKFTSKLNDVKNKEVYIVCVPTPISKDFKPVLTYVESVRDMIEQVVQSDALVINESTVGIGDTRKVFGRLLEKKNVKVAHSPERVDPGRTDPPLHAIPKVVGGLDDKSNDAVLNFYNTVFDKVVPVTNSEHSECTKLLENSYRAVNIMFINEVDNFCKSKKMNTKQIINAASTKPFGYQAFWPGVGVGGHCISTDPEFLVNSSNKDEWPILSTVMERLHERPREIARYFAKDNSLNNVLIVGVGFKPNINDIRESPQLYFAQELRDKFQVEVEYYDNLVFKFDNFKKVMSLRDSEIELYDKIFVAHINQSMPAGTLETLESQGDRVHFF